MITIKQDMPLDRQKANIVFNRVGTEEINMNTQLIKDDIIKLEKLMTENISNTKKTNIKNTTSYLKRLLSKAEKGIIELSWIYNNNKVSSYPVEINSIKQLGIEAIDYFNIEKSKMVHIDYLDMCNLIAYEIMYRDMDETIDSIESKLKSIGIISIYAFSDISELIPNNTYEMGKVLKVADSPYIKYNGNGMLTYFGTEAADRIHYRDVVEKSCSEAILIMLISLLSRLQDLSVKFKLCSVTDTGFYIMLDDTVEFDIDKFVSETAIVRAFGRKFEINSRVQIY